MIPFIIALHAHHHPGMALCAALLIISITFILWLCIKRS